MERRAPWFGSIRDRYLPRLKLPNAGVVFADLARLECRTLPMASGRTDILREFDDFFARPGMQRVPMQSEVFGLATELRASHRVTRPSRWVALCREMRHNAAMSSVRIARSLFESAKAEAEAMHRSLAGQIEYWAELGRAVEALGLSVEDAKSLFYRARIERDDPFLKLLKSSDSPIQHVHAAVLRDSKRARQAIDYEAQKRGWVSPSQMSPFAGVKIKAHIREVPLD